MKETLHLLLSLVIKKDTENIKRILTSVTHAQQKGLLFEHFLTALYNGNGYVAKHNGKKSDLGADILLYHPKNLKKVIRIVQAKNHVQPLDKNDTRLEILKFEEEASLEYNCKHYSMVSVSGYSEEAQKYEELSTVSLKGWSFVEELIEQYDPNKTKPSIDLFPHNETAFRNIQRLWKQHNRTCAIQATGTGKTFLIIKAIMTFPQQRVLVLAPSEYIFNQIEENGAWVSQDVTYMTYSKLIRLTKTEIKELNPSLIVLDEFHRTGAQKWGKSVTQLLTTFSKAKILGTTATPIRYLDGSRNMASELFGNNQASHLPLSEAIVKKILPMPRYICALYTIDEEIHKLEENMDLFQTPILKKKWMSQIKQFKVDWEHANGIPQILKKHITTEKKFIVFCKNREHLEQMEWLVESWFKKSKISSRIDKYRVMSNEKDNKSQLQAFIQNNDEHSIKLLFSIDMLNEGLHVESVDGVILLRPTESPTIFYQQIGRAIQANKKECPLIFDFVNNFNSIRANDFIQDIQHSKHILEQKRKQAGLNTLHLSFTIQDETKPILEFQQDIQRKIQDPWIAKFEELLAFKEFFGHLVVNDMKTPYLSLKHWCIKQREHYQQNLLSEDKQEQLLAIGFTLNEEEEKWNHYLQDLKTFKEKHGHVRTYLMPSPYVYLRQWCRIQQQDFMYGKLSSYQMTQLLKLGFMLNPQEENWYKMCDEWSASLTNHTDLHKQEQDSLSLELQTWQKEQVKALLSGSLNSEQQALLYAINPSLFYKEEIHQPNETQNIAIKTFESIPLQIEQPATFLSLEEVASSIETEPKRSFFSLLALRLRSMFTKDENKEKRAV